MKTTSFTIAVLFIVAVSRLTQQDYQDQTSAEMHQRIQISADKAGGTDSDYYNAILDVAQDMRLSEPQTDSLLKMYHL